MDLTAESTLLCCLITMTPPIPQAKKQPVINLLQRGYAYITSSDAENVAISFVRRIKQEANLNIAGCRRGPRKKISEHDERIMNRAITKNELKTTV